MRNTARISLTSRTSACSVDSASRRAASVPATSESGRTSSSSSGDIQPSLRLPSEVTRPRPGTASPAAPAIASPARSRSARIWIMPQSWTCEILANASAIRPAPFLVVEYRIDDPRLVAFLTRNGEFQHLTHAVRSMPDQTHGNRPVQRRRHIGRGHPALRLALTIRIHALIDSIDAVGQHPPVNAFQADELPAFGIGHVAALLCTLADEIGLFLADRPAKAQILRDHRAVGFVADHDKAFFGPHDMHGLGTIGRNAQVLASLMQLFPKLKPAVGRNGHLKGQL